MISTNTVDTITEGSTLRGSIVKQSRRAGAGIIHNVTNTKTDDIGARVYKDVCMDSDFSGHKDDKNHRLTVKNKAVHNMRHGNQQNRNFVEFNGHMKMSHDRVNSRILNLSDTQPAGCNGPVMCKLGKKMQNIVTQHDPKAPVHAVTHTQFSHGGIQRGSTGNTSMMAPGAVPVNGPEGEALNNAVGLNYAINIGPSDAIVRAQQKEFMSNMSRR